MNKKIRSALISVFYKEGLEPIVQILSDLAVTIYTTGGTQEFIQKMGIKVIPVETVTSYPSILGGRVKTLHPSVFGGILGRRDIETDVQEMKHYNIPEIDLVIVDLYPFEETVSKYKTSQVGQGNHEIAIIEKIDIGGPSMIRGAAKNFKDVLVIATKRDYSPLVQLLREQNGETTLEQRREFAAKAFEIIAHYDIAIAKYFNQPISQGITSNGLFFLESVNNPTPMRYGENPHQQAIFYGDLEKAFNQLHGKELSYNNLVDIDAAIQLINEFPSSPIHNNDGGEATFAIIKHTNVCGIAKKNSVKEAWDAALTGDPESAFGGVLICNKPIDRSAADGINSIFFEVLIAPFYDEDALAVLKSKKNRILLQQKESFSNPLQYKSILNGVLVQQKDEGNYIHWNEVGGRECTPEEKKDLAFANIICKHLKSNAIALVKNRQLVGKGCGQTSRIDSLRQAIEKSKQFNFNLKGAAMASDAFFPFNDCVKMGHEEGITAFIQPGGSIRDNDSIEYCKQNNLAMVMTGLRHFKH
jgi:phosphoribosylaminoimidazolecarboxamide formyltransferase / IMP cyclohydrolase